MIKNLFFIGSIFLTLTSCTSTSARRDATAGSIGCDPKDIQILNETGNTWQAVCDGRKYMCSATGGASVSWSCKEMQKK